MNDDDAPKALSKALIGYDFSGSKYSNQDRIRGVVAYQVHGTYFKASKATDIPESTIRQWAGSEWWEKLCTEVRAEKEDEFRAGFSRIIESAQSRVEDALEHGETKLVKTQNGLEEKLVPVGAKDAIMIGAISYDKLRISQNLPTSISAGADTKGVLAKLEELYNPLDQREASVISEQ